MRRFVVSGLLASCAFLSTTAFAQVSPPDFKPVENPVSGSVDFSSGKVPGNTATIDRSGGKGFNSIKIPGLGEFGKDGQKIEESSKNKDLSQPRSDFAASSNFNVDDNALRALLSDPKKLLGLAMMALDSAPQADNRMQDAISRYFLIRLTDQKKAVWLGDTSKPRIAYAFVDWSSPYAGFFVKAVEEFSDKAGIKTTLIPAWVNLDQRNAALAVSSITQRGDFVDFYNKVTSDPKSYSGKPSDYFNVDMDAAALDIETVDPVESAHLMLSALQAPQPMILMSEGSVYVGDISNSDEMVDFFNKAQPPATRTSGPSVGYQMPLPPLGQGQ